MFDVKNLAFKIMVSFAHDLMRPGDCLINLTQKHIRARLAEALLLINDNYGTHPNTGDLNVTLKRSYLAGLSNMTQSNVFRVFLLLTRKILLMLSKKKLN